MEAGSQQNLDNQLTEARPFRDDTSDRQRRIAGYEEAVNEVR
jgi:hypothetical protein